MSKIKRILYLLLPFILIFQITVLSENHFSDVFSEEWYYNAIVEMTENGYLNGYPDGNFYPDSVITAAEFVSVTARAGGAEEKTAQNSHWAGKLMQSALERGWYDWDEIPPTAETYDQPISRQLAVKIIMKAFAPDARGDYNAESVKIADFSALNGRYYDSVLAAFAKGISVGDENGNFNPSASLTRAEACALITRAMNKLSYPARPYEKPSSSSPPKITAEKGVSKNGHLQVIGTQLCNEYGEAIVLRGMSSHGIQWFPQFLSKECIQSTADSGANLFRAAMYTDENGYITNPSVKNTLINAVDTAISLDMYVIIDWHILRDGNPNTYKEHAKEFFAEMASRYRGNPAVLYEICNEPNGNITWTNDVKPYAEELINTIRTIDDKAIILVGSPTWSQDLHEVSKNPIITDNIMYTCHFYAGTHTDWLCRRITDALSQNVPVFVTEWGTSDASGSGGVYLKESEAWLEFLNTNRISWANWSYCDKNESSAAVRNGADLSDGISADELTESGKFVFSHF